MTAPTDAVGSVRRDEEKISRLTELYLIKGRTSMLSKVLVVGISGNFPELLDRRCTGGRVSITACASVDAALKSLSASEYDVLVWYTDSAANEQAKGFQMLDLFSQASSRTFVVVVTGPETNNVPLDRLRAYAHRTFTRPVDEDEVCEVIFRALRQQALVNKDDRLGDPHIPAEFEGMLGMSLPMLELFQRIDDAAAQDISVLITGETGTGKDLVAAAIHKRSQRKNGPYIAVNTGAMPRELIASELFGHEKGAFTGASEAIKGYFEKAHGGTIFLDEIGATDDKVQVSLLRVLETKTFRRVGGEKDICANVRIIAATNENLEEAVKQRKFREDLFYRLEVFHLHVPPLRDRPGGVTLLTNQFVSHFNAMYRKSVRTISPQTWEYLRGYPWPGNVRELKNVIQRAVLMAREQELTSDLLPARIRASYPADARTAHQHFPIRSGMTLSALERELILVTLASTKGNKKEAAIKLGVSRRALYDKLKKHGLR